MPPGYVHACFTRALFFQYSTDNNNNNNNNRKYLQAYDVFFHVFLAAVSVSFDVGQIFFNWIRKEKKSLACPTNTLKVFRETDRVYE